MTTETKITLLEKEKYKITGEKFLPGKSYYGLVFAHKREVLYFLLLELPASYKLKEYNHCKIVKSRSEFKQVNMLESFCDQELYEFSDEERFMLTTSNGNVPYTKQEFINVLSQRIPCLESLKIFTKKDKKDEYLVAKEPIANSTEVILSGTD